MLPRHDAVLSCGKLPRSPATRIRFLTHSAVSRIGWAAILPQEGLGESESPPPCGGWSLTSLRLGRSKMVDKGLGRLAEPLPSHKRQTGELGQFPRQAAEGSGLPAPQALRDHPEDAVGDEFLGA